MTVAIRESQKSVGSRFQAGPITATEDGQTTIKQVDREQAGESLPALLTRMGVTGLAYRSLMEREDLLDDPSPVLAWWWYVLTQEEVQRPARVAVHALATHFPPRTNYLELARTWFQVTAGHRAQIEDSLQSCPSCQALADRWSPIYPELTPGAFVAFIGLYAAAPQELGYSQSNSQWGEVFERKRESDQ